LSEGRSDEATGGERWEAALGDQRQARRRGSPSGGEATVGGRPHAAAFPREVTRGEWICRGEAIHEELRQGAGEAAIPVHPGDEGAGVWGPRAERRESASLASRHEGRLLH
ncbi:unnamed protein product, partial [Urochloa humidicola]